MATSFQKTYSVTVTFTKDDPVSGTDKMPSNVITDADLHSVELRNTIKEGIEKASRRSIGVYSAQPGVVGEV